MHESAKQALAIVKTSEILAAKSSNVFNAYRGSGADSGVVQQEYRDSLSGWHKSLRAYKIERKRK